MFGERKKNVVGDIERKSGKVKKCITSIGIGLIAIRYFVDEENERPLPVYSGDWIGKEYNGINIMLYESALYTKAELESAAQTAL